MDFFCSYLGKLTALSTSIFYFFCGIINLLFGCRGDRGSRRSWGSPPQYDLDVFTIILAPIIFLLSPVILLARFLYGCLYVTVRYISKYWSRERTPTPPKTSKLHDEGASAEYHIDQPQQELEPVFVANKPEPSPNWPLLPDPFFPPYKTPLNPHKIRLPMELTIQIVRHLHHSDLSSLAQSSHALRAIFFGTANPSAVASSLHQFVACTTTTHSVTAFSTILGTVPRPACAVCHIHLCHVRFSPLPFHTI